MVRVPPWFLYIVVDNSPVSTSSLKKSSACFRCDLVMQLVYFA